MNIQICYITLNQNRIKFKSRSQEYTRVQMAAEHQEPYGPTKYSDK